jgi:hypothetical protein
MSEGTMIELLQHALDHHGIDDRIDVAGQFEPRGHTGGLFAGGMLGSDAGGMLGGVAGNVGMGVGSLAGMHAADAASGLPSHMLLGVSATAVYGFAETTRRREPTQLVFRVERAGLTTKVHQRVNVRILELIDDASGSRIELEGGRIPVTHSKDVIEALA